MDTKTVFRASSIGDCNIRFTGVSEKNIIEIRKFSEDLDSRVGTFFDIRRDIELFHSRDIERARKMFSEGTECDYKGSDMPLGWKLRSIRGGYVFYSSRRDAFIEIGKSSKTLEVRLYSDEDDFGMLRHGVIDMLQLGTSMLLVHSVAIEKDGKGILFVGNSGTGKTTLHTQLISAGYGFNLVTEGHSLISDGKIFQVKTMGLIRNGALRYLGLESDSDMDVDFRDYVGTKSCVQEINLIIVPSFKLDGEYYTKDIQVSIKPMYRDWLLQVCDDDEREALYAKKMKQVGMLPGHGIMFKYSADAEKTAELFSNLIGELRC